MNAGRDLNDLACISQRRLAGLRGRVSGLQGKNSGDLDAAVASTVIDAAGLWNSFLRAYYLSIARIAWTRSGNRLSFTQQFPSHTDAVLFAITTYGSPLPRGKLLRRHDPPWHDLQFYVRLLNRVGYANMSVIAAALGRPTLFFRFLPTVRNFYAHRCEETFDKAARLGVVLGLTSRLNLHPNATLTTVGNGKSCDLVTDWLYDLEWVIDDLCA